MKKLNLSDRESIEIGIVRHQPLVKIYELIDEDDEDMRILMNLMDMKPISPDEVNLTKSLLIRD